MNKARVQTLVWVLVYIGLLTLSVAVFVLRAGGGALGWAMVVLGSLVAAVGAALVVVRARMDAPAGAGGGASNAGASKVAQSTEPKD